MPDRKYGPLFTQKDVQQLVVLGRISPRASVDELVAEARERGDTPPLTFPADEPLFLIRGQDIAAAPAVMAYGNAAAEAGAKQQFLDDLGESYRQITEFQAKPGPNGIDPTGNAKIPD